MLMTKRMLLIVLLLSGMVACSKQNTPAAKENVEQALKQNGMANVNVDEDRDKGVITLKGDVQSEDQKQQAGRAAQQAAPGKVVANELAVRPAGMESTASKVDSNTDDAIEDHFKAVIAANRWENQHIRSDAKNGVLTLKGDVDTSAQRAAVERAAATIPGVQQVVNELEVKKAKRR
jgi:hyperosmotically inducible periplasmic protein